MDKGYTPRKGLTAEEIRYHCMAEALHVSVWEGWGSWKQAYLYLYEGRWGTPPQVCQLA